MSIKKNTVLNERYAETIIGSESERFDMVEIHGVRDTNPPNSDGSTCCEIDDQNPQFFSVYLHVKDEGVDCIGDFCTHALAKKYADEIAAQYGWNVSDYVPDTFKGHRVGPYVFDLKLEDEKFQIDVDVRSEYGYFEHHELGDECAGGLWFEGVDLIDYDGVFELPKRVVAALRSAGFTLDESFGDLEPAQQAS